MDLVSGRPFWPVHDGPMPSFPPLDRDKECDVAVVGGGISGALLAYYLTQAGLDTLVVDSRTLGTGSTSASTALIEYLLDADLGRLIEMLGEDDALRCYQLCRDAVLELERIVQDLDGDCEFERKTGLYIASRKKDIAKVRRETATRARYGFEVSFMEAGALRRQYSLTAPGAMLSVPAAQVDPYKLTRELLLTARRRGLHVVTRTQVRSIQAGADQSQLVTTEGARITARRVVFAAGYEMLSHLPEGLASLKSTYALVSRPMTEMPDGVRECVITETLRPYLYTRTTSDARIMIGGEDEDYVEGTGRERQIPRKTKVLLKKFGRWFPDLTVDAEYAWAGAFAYTKDGLGYLDRNPKYPNLFYLLGTGGNGMTFSIVAAQILRDICTGKENGDFRLFRFSRRFKE